MNGRLSINNIQSIYFSSPDIPGDFCFWGRTLKLSGSAIQIGGAAIHLYQTMFQNAGLPFQYAGPIKAIGKFEIHFDGSVINYYPYPITQLPPPTGLYPSPNRRKTPNFNLLPPNANITLQNSN